MWCNKTARVTDVVQRFRILCFQLYFGCPTKTRVRTPASVFFFFFFVVLIFSFSLKVSRLSGFIVIGFADSSCW